MKAALSLCCVVWPDRRRNSVFPDIAAQLGCFTGWATSLGDRGPRCLARHLWRSAGEVPNL